MKQYRGFEQEMNILKNGKMFYGWWIVIGIAILLAVMGPASVAAANLFQNSVVEEFGIGNSQFALSNSLVLGVGIFLSPFVARMVSGKHFKKFLTAAVIIYGAAYIGYGFAPNIYVFYLLSILVGIGNISTTIVPAGVLINNWFVEKRGLAMSLAFSGLGIGGMVTSQIIPRLITTAGWRTTYLLYGLAMLIIGLAVVWFLLVQKPEDKGLAPLGGAERTTHTNIGEGEAEQTNHTAISFKSTMKKPFFILMVVGAIFVGLANNGGLGQFPPYLQGIHGVTQGALIVTIYSGVGIIGKLALGTINDQVGIIKSTIYAATLLVATYALMIFGGNYIIAVIAAVLFGMGNAIGTVSPPLITSSIYSSENYAQAYGYIQSGVQLGMTFGSLVAAGIADFSSYSVAWIVLAVISALIAVSWIAAYKNSQKYTEI